MMVLGTAGCIGLGAFAYLFAKHEAAKISPVLEEHGSSEKPSVATATSDDDGEEEDDVPMTTTTTPAPAVTKPPAQTPRPQPASGGGRVTCTAMGSFRLCGFGGACNPMTASGVGSGGSEPEARSMAINNCQNSIRARGGNGMCSVGSCSR
jgi:hypothetical protein